MNRAPGDAYSKLENREVPNKLRMEVFSMRLTALELETQRQDPRVTESENRLCAALPKWHESMRLNLNGRKSAILK